MHAALSPVPWNRFPRRVKRRTRDALWHDQYYLCAYCECSVEKSGAHIEHLKPKHSFPLLTYDYANLVASCQGDIEKNLAQGQDRSCGHEKGMSYSPAEFVSPLDPLSGSLYSYTLDGKIYPKHHLSAADHAKAEYMINLLKLDCLRLQNRRRGVMEAVVRAIAKLKHDRAKLLLFMNHQLKPKRGGDGRERLNSFYSARRQRF